MTRATRTTAVRQDKDNINGMHHLALEATAINQNFSQQVGGSRCHGANEGLCKGLGCGFGLKEAAAWGSLH